MSDVTTVQPIPRKAAEYRAAIDQLFAEIDRLNVKMDQYQVRIERSRAESHEIAAETAVIRPRIQARLDALKTVV